MDNKVCLPISTTYISTRGHNIDYLIIPTKLWYTIMQQVIKYELNLFTLKQTFAKIYFYHFAFDTNLQVLLYFFTSVVLQGGSDVIYTLVPCSNLIYIYMLQLSVYEPYQVLCIRRPTSLCGLRGIETCLSSGRPSQHRFESQHRRCKIKIVNS